MNQWAYLSGVNIHEYALFSWIARQDVPTSTNQIGVSIGNDDYGWFDIGYYESPLTTPIFTGSSAGTAHTVTSAGYIRFTMYQYTNYFMQRRFLIPNIPGQIGIWVTIKDINLKLLYSEKYMFTAFPSKYNPALPIDVPGVPPVYEIPVYAFVTVKNTGGLSYAPKIGFSIRPSAATQWKDAPLVTAQYFGAGGTQTTNTGTVNVPAGVHGRVYAWIAIYDPNGVELARVGGPGDTTVYFDVP